MTILTNGFWGGGSAGGYCEVANDAGAGELISLEDVKSIPSTLLFVHTFQHKTKARREIPILWTRNDCCSVCVRTCASSVPAVQ